MITALESGDRGVTLDEWPAISFALFVSPLALISADSDGLVWLTPGHAVDQEGLENFISFGDPLALGREAQQAVMDESYGRALATLAWWLLDAQRQGDKTALRDTVRAIARSAENYESAKKEA